jgi:hypothetical protein
VRAKEQIIFCEIVSETVHVRRRRTCLGGLSGYFAQCDQPDCQYSDENKAPCPLRPTMFARQCLTRRREISTVLQRARRKS